jgi:predicted ATPase
MAKRTRVSPGRASSTEPFVRSVTLDAARIADRHEFPWAVPAIETPAGLAQGLARHPKVTFLIGENGAGKSTLIEGIAACAGFGEQGGIKFLRADTPEWSPLTAAMRLIRGSRRERDGFFLRAESFYNVGTRIEEIAREDPVHWLPMAASSPTASPTANGSCPW